MGLLDDAAAAWKADEDREQVDEAWQEQRDSKRAQQVAGAVSDGDRQMTDEEALEFAQTAWVWLDTAATKLGGPHYELSEAQMKRLIPVSAKMAKKHIPAGYSITSIEDLIPLELLFLGTVAWIYVPKAAAAREAKKAAKTGAAPGQPAPEKEVPGEVTHRSIRAVP